VIALERGGRLEEESFNVKGEVNLAGTTLFG